MKELTIHHFPSKGKSRSRVRVSYRPQEGAQAHEREVTFKFTITDEDRHLIQWYLEEYLLYPWGEFRSRAQQAEALMERLGVELFDAVFGSKETNALYAHVADGLINTRIVIHADNPEGIALPWELMRDPTWGEYGDLSRLARSFVRSQPDLIFQPPPARADEATFNILMVISRPGGPEGDVPFQSVARPLLELFRPHRDRIRLDVLRPPTFEQLSRVLSDKPNFYHVLHFDGHGTFPQGGDAVLFYTQTGAQGRLLFEGENGKPRDVTGEELGGLLAGKGVSVVLLNVCQSGMTRPEALYPSVGNQLLKAGACGVVAMAYSVYVQTAARFMARLYEGLINGEELSRAVALAREELRAHPQRLSPIGEIELSDWVVPVLFEAAPFSPLPRSGEETGVRALRLDPNILQDQQAKAGAEIDCPEPPAFGFIGRDGVILDLERAFQTETIVLLEGMAGVGKTETAIGFARWRAETGALGGPIFFFSFERYLPLAGVCDRMGQVFQRIIKEQLREEWHLLNAEHRLQVALAILKQVPCLMIWDNFEPVAGFPKGIQSAWKPDEQKELRDFLSNLRGGRTKVLLTSRRDEPWLKDIYHRVELGGLKLVEAQELAVRVLLRAGLKPEEIKGLPQYNDLLKYLRGNPLAIQIVLPEIKRMKPDELLKALRAGEVKLSEDDPTQGRERSLTTSLTYRLDALDPVLRKRLGVLALFQGFVDADVLAAMCQQVEGAPELIRGLGRGDWIRILDAAAEVGLLRRVGEYLYTVHPALPWFFHDLLREAFPDHLDWLERAFAAAYGTAGSELSQMFETNAEPVITLLQAEENNLMQALRLAQRHERWDDMIGILYGLNQLLTTRGRWVEWERLITDIEAEVEDAGGKPLTGRENLWRALLGHRSEIYDYRRDFDSGQTTLLRLKDHFERVGDDRNQAASLHDLGIIAQKRRQFDEAEWWYHQALSIFERIGNEHGQAITLHQLGMIAQERRQYEEAERWYRQSLAIKERIGDEHGQASTLHQLGMIAEEQRQYKEAERWYRQSLATEKRIGDEHGQAITLHQLGVIVEERGNLEEAVRFYEQAEAIFERTNDPHSLGIVRRSLQRAGVAQARELNKEGKWQEAERILNACIQRCKEQSDLTSAVTLFRERAQVRMKMRAYDQARWDYKKAASLCEELGDVATLAIVEVELAELEYQTGLFKDAAYHLESAAEHLQTTGDEERIAHIHQLLEDIRTHAVSHSEEASV